MDLEELLNNLWLVTIITGGALFISLIIDSLKQMLNLNIGGGLALGVFGLMVLSALGLYKVKKL